MKTKKFNPETKPTTDINIETIKYDKKHKLILFVKNFNKLCFLLYI